MGYWQFHALNARHGLTLLLSDIRAAAGDAVAVVSERHPLPDFDLVARADAALANSEWGVAATTPSAGVIELTLDPARFSAPLVQRVLVRQMLHLLRTDAVGAGGSLGDAVVAEGLAGHFVSDTLGGPADPWDLAPVAQSAMKRAITEWAWPQHDHAEWFLGRGKLRRWTGHGLGHQLIAAHLALHPEASALTLADAPTDTFRPTLRSLIGLDTDLPEPDEPPEADAAPTAASDAPAEAVTDPAATVGTAPSSD